jgi:hypothetical protein
MLNCATHNKSSLEKSKTCNGFAVSCLLQLPLDALRRGDRERIVLSWSIEKSEDFTSSSDSLAWKMHPLDTAILSLKARVSRVPTFYEVSPK